MRGYSSHCSVLSPPLSTLPLPIGLLVLLPVSSLSPPLFSSVEWQCFACHTFKLVVVVLGFVAVGLGFVVVGLGFVAVGLRLKS